LAVLPEASGYLNLREDQSAVAEGIFHYRQRHEMQRMFLGPFQPRPGRTEILTVENAREIEQLYSTGDSGGISFGAFQLHSGLFRGIRREGKLIHVAGVHVSSKLEGVAAIGNVFTRPDCRGQGLAQVVTSAVVTSVSQLGIHTIGLNVETANSAAI